MSQHTRDGAASASLVAVSDVFRCLASPVRVAIVERLSAGEACVHDLVDALGTSQPLVSQHLRVLRGANLVTRVRRGREVAYALADEHVAHIVRDALQHAEEPLPRTGAGLDDTDEGGGEGDHLGAPGR